MVCGCSIFHLIFEKLRLCLHNELVVYLYFYSHLFHSVQQLVVLLIIYLVGATLYANRF
uniref:Uncharacterized protein n=1 Tax=Arundo donax TaxID=35708 RepID=A0A0A9HXM7_ARUDO